MTDSNGICFPSRRGLLAASCGLSTAALVSAPLARAVTAEGARLPPYGHGRLPAGVRSRSIQDINGLTVHFLEAGYEDAGRPTVLLLHGFPDLAYGWRRVMPGLASAGYYVVAPDLRGYGRTTGWDDAYDADLTSFGLLGMVRDAEALVMALGHRELAAVIGHDVGSSVAAWCALVRPDMFRSVVLMSGPFAGTPKLAFDTADGAVPPPAPTTDAALAAALAALPRPRKYYQHWYATRLANADLMQAPQGLHDFFRAYYYFKSADWTGNHPFPLKARTAEEFAKMPTYYVMDLRKGMADTVAAEMPSAAEIASCKWLTEADVEVYATEYRNTSFQGGLQFYRLGGDPKNQADLRTFAGRTIDVPSCFIAGKSDWGVYQSPGATEAMRTTACTRMTGFHLVEGAGHWVQQEQPDRVAGLLTEFLRNVSTP